MTDQRIALVTGANQGIGYALATGLAARLGPGDLVLLTGRNPERVAEAAARASGAPGRVARVAGRVLDVTNAAAVAALAEELRRTHGGVDVVLSNAGARITPDRPQEEQADEFIAVANEGTHAVLRSFGPVLRPGGRLLVVASRFGRLGHLEPRLRPLFEHATLDEVEAAVRAWRAAIHAGDAQERGWPRWLNVPSKVAQVAAVRAVARERRDVDLREHTLIAAVCPGLVDTEASRPWFDDFSRVQTPDEAAAKVLDVVCREGVDPELHGQLIRFGEALPWLGGTPPTGQDRLIADRVRG